MNTSLVAEQSFFGLFELDDSGTVLYCRIEVDSRSDGTTTNLTGQNFYKEIAPFDNIEEFRQRIARFARSPAQADNFIFTCRINRGSMPVRVLLARIRERSNVEQTKSILVHIRKSRPPENAAAPLAPVSHNRNVLETETVINE